MSYLVNKGQLYAVRLFELMVNEMFRKELAKLNMITREKFLDHTIMNAANYSTYLALGHSVLI